MESGTFIEYDIEPGNPRSFTSENFFASLLARTQCALFGAINLVILRCMLGGAGPGMLAREYQQLISSIIDLLILTLLLPVLVAPTERDIRIIN